jgi:hypothetical protein
MLISSCPQARASRWRARASPKPSARQARPGPCNTTRTPSNASLYHLDISTTVIPNPTVTYDNGRTLGYAFTISGGAVTGMQLQVSDGNHSHTTTLPVVPTSSFTVAGNVVNETLVFGNVVENIRYVPSGTSGLYAIASLTDTFISAGTATTLLDVEPFERAAFTLDANKAVTQVQSVAVDGTHKTVAIGSNVYTQLAPGFILETQKDGSTSRYEVFHDGNGDGVYTAVAHGSGTTIDLVGLKAQISAAMDGVL